MSKLIYFMPASLDGFIAGETDNMDWSVPDEEVSAFINDRVRPVGTYLFGRKLYEVWRKLNAYASASSKGNVVGYRAA